MIDQKQIKTDRGKRRERVAILYERFSVLGRESSNFGHVLKKHEE